MEVCTSGCFLVLITSVIHHSFNLQYFRMTFLKSEMLSLILTKDNTPAHH